MRMEPLYLTRLSVFAAGLAVGGNISALNNLVKEPPKPIQGEIAADVTVIVGPVPTRRPVRRSSNWQRSPRAWPP